MKKKKKKKSPLIPLPQITHYSHFKICTHNFKKQNQKHTTVYRLAFCFIHFSLFLSIYNPEKREFWVNI